MRKARAVLKWVLLWFLASGYPSRGGLPVPTEYVSALTVQGPTVQLDQAAERLFYRRGENAGGDGGTHRQWSFSGHGDLSRGHLSGAVQVIAGPSAPTRPDVVLQLRPRFRVIGQAAEAPDPVPVEWEARLGSLVANIDDGNDGGVATNANAEMRISMSLSTSQGTIIQQAFFESRWAPGSAGLLRAWPTTILPGSTREEGLVEDPETGLATTLRSLLTTADGEQWVEMIVPNWEGARQGTRDMVMRIRTLMTPDAPQVYDLAVRIGARVFARGGRAAVEWRDVKVRFRVPEGIRLEAENGQDLGGMEAGKAQEPPEGIPAAINTWTWNPEASVLELGLVPGEVGKVELQESRDLLNWEPIGPLGEGLPGVATAVEVDGLQGLGARRPTARMFRVVRYPD